MPRMALVCTVEAYPFLVRYLVDEGDARDGVAEHGARYEHRHPSGFAVVAEGEPVWDELHDLVPSVGAVGVVCRGPVFSAGHAARAAALRAVTLNERLAARGRSR